MVRWFGPSWGAPICEMSTELARPSIADRCFGCGGEFEPDEGGLWLEHLEADGMERRPWHLRCFLRSCGIDDAKPAPRAAPACHVMHEGATLCRCEYAQADLLGGRPGERLWPDGHSWVSLRLSHEATCPACSAIAFRRKAHEWFARVCRAAVLERADRARRDA